MILVDNDLANRQTSNGNGLTGLVYLPVILEMEMSWRKASSSKSSSL